MLEFYCTSWKAFSASLQKLDEELSGICQIINTVYKGLEKNDDKEDVSFSILKMGTIIWRYKVYKRHQKSLIKSIEITAK